MNKTLKLSFRRGDWIAIALVVIAAALTLAAFLPGGPAEDAVVQIYRNGSLIRELPLATDTTIEVNGDYRNTVSILSGRAAITESDCPGADCVHSGWISSAGRSIVCLPNRVEVRISGASEPDVDFVVG